MCTDVVSYASSLSLLASDTQINCGVPSWPFKSVDATVVLVDATYGLPGWPVGPKGSAARVTFRPSIQSVSPVKIAASSGGNLTIVGGFFDPEASDYACVLAWNDNQPVSLAARPLNYRSITCFAPVLPPGERATGVTLSLTKAGANVASASGVPTAYYPTWIGLSKTAGPALGGLTVEVHAWGLDPTVAHIVTWRNDLGHVANASVDFVNVSGGYRSDSAHVILPVWQFPSSKTNATLLMRPAAGSSWETVELKSGQNSASDSSVFEFQATLVSVDATVIPREGCQTLVCFPTVIRVSAFGLRTDSPKQLITSVNGLNSTDYACRFLGLDGSIIDALFSTTIDSQGGSFRPPEPLVMLLLALVIAHPPHRDNNRPSLHLNGGYKIITAHRCISMATVREDQCTPATSTDPLSCPIPQHP